VSYKKAMTSITTKPVTPAEGVIGHGQLQAWALQESARGLPFL
jgi:hypothetical protein